MQQDLELNGALNSEMEYKKTTIKLRIDVDYPYPSRLKSFLATVLKLKIGKDYLKNPKIIAKMINETPKKVQAYWFFTPYTLPDREILELLRSAENHHIGLHIANRPYTELERLEKDTGRKVKYYTVHGTAKLLAQLMWRRKLGEKKAPVPKGFPLKSFYEFPTIDLDWACYANPLTQVLKMSNESIVRGEVLHVHPEWLFQRGKINRRGPYYAVLKNILGVDKDLETLAIRKNWFIKIARDSKEYEKDVFPTDKFIEKLADRGIDVFTFIERKWCNNISKPLVGWVKLEDNIALLHVASYHEWWSNVGKKTRNMVRKAEKSGVKTKTVEPDEQLADGIWKIYNETPIRQKRAFPYYGISLQAVTSGVLSAQNSTFIAAFYKEELVGFIQLVYGNKIAVIAQILSLQGHSDKAVNNALLAKAVEVCANQHMEWVMYGRIGNHPSLDRFKENNSFSELPLTRYYVPVTNKGRLAVKLGLHRELKDSLPQALKSILFPFYNWVSRTKMQTRLRFRS